MMANSKKERHEEYETAYKKKLDHQDEMKDEVHKLVEKLNQVLSVTLKVDNYGDRDVFPVDLKVHPNWLRIRDLDIIRGRLKEESFQIEEIYTAHDSNNEEILFITINL